MISSFKISSIAYAEVKNERDPRKVMQFLMKLRPEFETSRGTLINHGDLKMEYVLRAHL